jgi:cytochrome P450
MAATMSVDLSDSALWRNGFPDELFAELRRERPVFRHGMTDSVSKAVGRDFWMTTKHRHAQRIHRDTESFTATDGPLIQPIGAVASFPTIINMDPPELNKRRRVMSHAFTPKAIGKLEDGIRTRAASLVDRLLQAGTGDWVEDIADVLPMSVIGDIIGIPEQDRAEVFDTFDRILKAETGASAEGQMDLYAKIFGYAHELTESKRQSPTDDIWSTLTSAVITDENGDRLSLEATELDIFFFVLAFAGSDTTKNALTTGIQAYVANPGEIDRYRTDAELRAGAVEEVLRWSTPVTFWTRTAKVDLEIDGVAIPKGDRVVSMLRSANRDEDIFADPFTFDIGREPNPHVAFGGGGPHHCLGAMLARAELRAVFDELLCRADDIELGRVEASYPNLTTNMSIFETLPVSVTAC